MREYLSFLWQLRWLLHRPCCPWRLHLLKEKHFCLSAGHPGWDRLSQWHFQECGGEQVEDGESAGEFGGSRVSPTQAGWHEPALERPEGQVGQHPVSDFLIMLDGNFFFFCVDFFLLWLQVLLVSVDFRRRCDYCYFPNRKFPFRVIPQLLWWI